MRAFPPTPVRYLITPGSLTSSNFHSEKKNLIESIRLAANAGIELVQIREKSLPARQVYELAGDAVKVVRGSGTKLLVNERFDIAVAAGVDGVNLTSTSIPVDRVRASVPDGFLVGVSAHSLLEVDRARDEGADFTVLGPIFTTKGKSNPLGIREFGDVCSTVAPFPVIGIGGIDASNANSVIDAGAAGYASIRYLNDFVRIGL